MSWECPYNINDYCKRLNKECEPGQKVVFYMEKLQIIVKMKMMKTVKIVINKNFPYSSFFSCYFKSMLYYNRYVGY